VRWQPRLSPRSLSFFFQLCDGLCGAMVGTYLIVLTGNLRIEPSLVDELEPSWMESGQGLSCSGSDFLMLAKGSAIETLFCGRVD